MDTRRGFFAVILGFSFLCCLSLAGSAQSTCAPPAPKGKLAQPILFTEQQELRLGELMNAQEAAGQATFRILPVHDKELSGYLEDLGRHLAQNMPASSIKPRFYLVDTPVVNASSSIAGQVYVTRKMVAYVHSEDELAAVLAHELGHVSVRQSAITLSAFWRGVLGITAIKNDEDLQRQFNAFLDLYRSKPQVFKNASKNLQAEQLGADEIGLYLLARGGYSPKTMADFWDRFAETKGNTGNFLSELFGTTPPQAKRLREMIKGQAAIPQSCINARPAREAAAFESWQKAVIAWSPTRVVASRAVGVEHKLIPPLRSGISQLKFSPDGKYVLAQDSASIYVFTREPFANLFRFDAVDADPAQFTPDSKSIVFSNSSLRVESWSIADQKRTYAYEMTMRESCLQHLLAPDGRTLGCVKFRSGEGRAAFDLVLYDVVKQAEIARKNSFIAPEFGSVANAFFFLELLLTSKAIAEMKFSPDAHYFIVGGWNAHFAYDLTARNEVHLPSSITRIMQRHFTFIGSDRLLLENMSAPDKSPLVQFPGGTKIRDVHIGDQGLSGAAHGDYVLLRPLRNRAVGVLDINTDKIPVASVQDALDVFDDFCVDELKSGQLELHNIKTGQQAATVEMPFGPLGRLRAAAFSPDLNTLAMSEAIRGGIFDLSSGKQLWGLRAFNGAWIENNIFRGLFPPDKLELARVMDLQSTEKNDAAKKPGYGVGEIDLTNGAARELMAFELQPSRAVFQAGPYVVIEASGKEHHSNDYDIEVRDLRTSKTVWTRHSNSAMRGVLEGNSQTMLMAWPVASDEGKRILRDDPEIVKGSANSKDQKYDLVLELVDLANGQARGHFLLETRKGSLLVTQFAVSGKTVVVADADHRLHVYTSKGEPKDVMFGSAPALSADGHWLAFQSGAGQFVLYDLTAAAKKEEFTLGANISATAFSRDGQRIAVLTSDQTVHLIDLAEAAKQTAKSMK